MAKSMFWHRLQAHEFRRLFGYTRAVPGGRTAGSRVPLEVEAHADFLQGLEELRAELLQLHKAVTPIKRVKVRRTCDPLNFATQFR